MTPFALTVRLNLNSYALNVKHRSAQKRKHALLVAMSSNLKRRHKNESTSILGNLLGGEAQRLFPRSNFAGRLPFFDQAQYAADLGPRFHSE